MDWSVNGMVREWWLLAFNGMVREWWLLAFNGLVREWNGPWMVIVSIQGPWLEWSVDIVWLWSVNGMVCEWIGPWMEWIGPWIEWSVEKKNPKKWHHLRSTIQAFYSLTIPFTDQSMVRGEKQQQRNDTILDLQSRHYIIFEDRIWRWVWVISWQLGWNFFLHSVHVNMKPCSGMRHVQNIGMPVTFNTGFFYKRQFSMGKTVIFFYFRVLVTDDSTWQPHWNLYC